jgi:hypothetical protein
MQSKAQQTLAPLNNDLQPANPFVLDPIKNAGHGAYHPKRIVLNDEIEMRGGSTLSTQERKRTDIDGGENIVQNGAKAIRRACADAGIDVLYLNVGGDKMAVLRKTITSVEGSMLASRFSGRWDDNLEKDHDGNFFIDQPIELFRPMIDYLRARACETTKTLPAISPDKSILSNKLQYNDFIRMVEYFGMTPGIFPTRVRLYAGNKENVEIVGHKVVARERAVFALEPQGHSRRIRSFEVILDQVESFEIGWAILDQVESFEIGWATLPPNTFVDMKPDKDFCSPTSFGMVQLSPGFWAYHGSVPSADPLGVGYFDNSVGLDLGRAELRHTFSNNTSPSNQQGVPVRVSSMRPGTVVRCTTSDTTMKWVYNGKEYATAVDQYKTPAFSGKGEWSILNILLD